MIYLPVLPGEHDDPDILAGNISVTDVLIKDGQLRMYKHFEKLIEDNGGSITLEQYREQIAPAVQFLRSELDKRVADTKQHLTDIGLLK